MNTSGVETLKSSIAPIRDALLAHPVYGQIEDVESLQLFMQSHVFAVWDFMSLLKALQRTVCCVDVPWVPPANVTACRLVNEIVLGEESDEDGQGNFASHFELYRNAMQQCGANVGPIDRLINAIRGGLDVSAALDSAGVAPGVREFVTTTFESIQTGDPCRRASAFTFGREDLLPDVFRRILESPEMSRKSEWNGFRYYLDRHIELDGGEHGASAERVVERLCGQDPARWAAAGEEAARALKARIRLWDAVNEQIAASRSMSARS